MITPFSGIILIDKAEGESSFSALSDVKRLFDTRRVGHTGTLDPMATGLLVALVGPATRCARYFNSLEKEYVGEITFGSETDTDDRTGEVTTSAPVPDMKTIVAAASEFIGRIRQTPPAYSAVHVDGRRAYKRARAGEEVRLPEREVTVYSQTCEPLDRTTVRMTVRCSSGTYIRSLARDLGRAVGSAAHLSALRRTRVGPFDVEESEEHMSHGSATHAGTLEISEALLRLGGFSELEVDDRTAEIMWNGGVIQASEALAARDGQIVARNSGRSVCVGYWENDRFRYDLVFARSDG